MREGIAAHGGYEINTEGDAFHIAFTTVAQAVSFAMEAQARATPYPQSSPKEECGRRPVRHLTPFWKSCVAPDDMCLTWMREPHAWPAFKQDIQHQAGLEHAAA